MSEIVTYKNEMNKVAFRKFNALEMDLFFSICSQARDKGTQELEFSFYDLRELSNYKRSTSNFIKDLEKTYDKLLQLNIKIGNEKTFEKFTLFTRYKVDSAKETVTIKVNDDFEYIFNNLTGNFTKFELEEFTNLKSSYSKTTYRLLKQYKTTGYYIVQIQEFKKLLEIPENYKMGNIDQRVLNPIKNELIQYFENLTITKIKARGKRNIDKIEFRFTPQTGINNGSKVFRDKETGEYYEKPLVFFDKTEIEKTYPEVNPLSDQLEGQLDIDDL